MAPSQHGRRKFMSAVGAVGAGALSGCMGIGDVIPPQPTSASIVSERGSEYISSVGTLKITPLDRAVVLRWRPVGEMPGYLIPGSVAMEQVDGDGTMPFETVDPVGESTLAHPTQGLSRLHIATGSASGGFSGDGPGQLLETVRMRVAHE